MLVFVLGFYSLLGFRNFRFVLYGILMVKVIGNCIVFLIFSLVFFVMFRILGKIVVDVLYLFYIFTKEKGYYIFLCLFYV